ncbi:AAA family ATPase [Bradyrhizobium japonicum]|uniref:AAA family ATPase n=1 Tax=Bradyrhizobium japonicum TaxID=375 RepID=UPI000577DB5B|nr:ATP-binding protein [Bradyrhizobium japonicum]
MTESKKFEGKDEFLALARLALSERPQDVQLFLGKVARRYRASEPEVATEIASLLKNSSGRSSALRRETAAPVPVDNDSRLHLIRIESPSRDMAPPVFAPSVSREVEALIQERRQIERLVQVDLEPTRSALFVGPPGVGKTLSARWIASQLNLPLLILDLSAVMSSFLGRTGNNVRAVLDYAKRQSCVLLLDELDAIAKRRDDATEIGELKRLVTVLLQEIDEWPVHGLLLAATNHSELLDPAVWRRFDSVINFPPPEKIEVERAIVEFLGDDRDLGEEWIEILSILFRGANFSDIRKRITALRRAATMNERNVAIEIEDYIGRITRSMPHSEVLALARKLYGIHRISQRRVAVLTGVSRDTLRRTEDKGSKASRRGRGG